MLIEWDGIMEELKKDEKLFDDRELEDLSDEKIHLTDKIDEELKKELDDYFKENKIKYDEKHLK